MIIMPNAQTGICTKPSKTLADIKPISTKPFVILDTPPDTTT
jgi:hypothetical protein